MKITKLLKVHPFRISINWRKYNIKNVNKQKTPLKLISEGNHTNKGKSTLTSFVACFILGIVFCRTYWSGYACGL